MLELVFKTPLQDTDWISDCLIAAGALAVTVEDAQAQEDKEVPIFAEPGMPTDILAWPQSTLIALLPEELSPKEFWSQAILIEPRLDELSFDLRTLVEQDWVRENQRQFNPFVIPNELWVGPTWKQPPSDLVEKNRAIRIDPGMAFGTASHATTQLCLEQILRVHGANGSLGRVLDVGCGSGILAIAAAKLGATEAVGIDIDPLAIQASTANAKANKVKLVLMSADSSAEGLFDLVIANILSQPLKVLAPAIAGHLRHGGSMLLSGILSRQADEIIAVYQPLCAGKGLVQVLAEREGWACIGIMTKKEK